MHHQSKTTHNTAMTNEDYMNEELEALAVMTEEEACRVYNVDFKAEAEIYIVHSLKQKNMMTKLFRSQMRQVMTDAWRYRITGESFSESLKRAWTLLKLKAQMKQRTVQFFYQKVNGEIRQAFGTLKDEVISSIVKGNGRRPSDNLFTYFDTERNEFRSFKKFNLIRIG